MSVRSAMSKCPSNGYAFCHLNVQSLTSKLDEISDFLSRSECSVILGISETWLDSSVTDAAVTVENFKLYRKDRRYGRGG